MSEMIRKVADALLEVDYMGESRMTRQEAEALARAAIKAMKDPTVEMEEAGDDLDDWGVPSDPGSGNASALAHWHAMIDVALGATK